MEFTMTNWDFLIRDPFIKKAADALRALDLPIMGIETYYDDDFSVIESVCDFFGFEFESDADGIHMVNFFDGIGGVASIDLMEKVFKAISRAVEPGSFIEFSDDGELVRYVFLYDVVEKWSVPHVLFKKKEAI